MEADFMIKKCSICGKEKDIPPYRIKKENFCSLKCYGVWHSQNDIGIRSPAWRGGKVEKICNICGKFFYVNKYRANTAMTCSEKCRSILHGKNHIGENGSNWRGGEIKKICKFCGTQFTTYAHRKDTSKYCSRKCSFKGRYNKIDKICSACGKHFMAYPSKIKDGGGKYCSLKCTGTVNRKYRSGSNSTQWRGGKIKCVCKLCKKEFYKSKSRIGYGHVKYCSYHCRAIAGILNGKKKDTSIEIKMEQELAQRGILFQKQYPILQARTIPDFFIDPNICIYCDGDYWHNRLETRIKDKQQDFTLQFIGYKVYRFWEHDINKNISKCIDKIKEINHGRHNRIRATDSGAR